MKGRGNAQWQLATGMRNLGKTRLGGVVFGCKDNTIKECLTKQLFGLPAHHFAYVKDVDPGLPLFLFNYSERKLYGIFEAASCGQMNINPYGWTTDGSQRTQFPAQVQVHVRLQCQPLRQDQFKPIIADNYYVRDHFWFELDHTQTSKLVSLFTSFPVDTIPILSENTKRWRIKPQTPPSLTTGREQSSGVVEQHVDEPNEQSDYTDFPPLLHRVNEPQEGLLNPKIDTQVREERIKSQGSTPTNGHQNRSLVDDGDDSNAFSDMRLKKRVSADESGDEQEKISRNQQAVITQLTQEVEELRAFKREQCDTMGFLERKLAESEEEIHRLEDRCMKLESLCISGTLFANEVVTNSSNDLLLDPAESIYLFGGSDGQFCSSAFEAYFPTQDVIKCLTPMSSVRSCASAAELHGEIYIVGGGNGQLWYDTVEAYNFQEDQWTLRPSLSEEKGSLACIALYDKIFAIGGGNGLECFSHVEMLDLDVGRWIPSRSMQQKRFSLAAVEINGAIYATGGYDGNRYLRSVERFDPREHSWTGIASMNTERACHSLVVLNDKLYSLGGYDGNTIVNSTEIYDPRNETWMNGDLMHEPRGYSAAAVVQGSIYVFGGVNPAENSKNINTVEYFKEGQGWKEYSTESIRRSYMSAIAITHP